MSRSVDQFIEANIDAIDGELWNEVFLNAYQEFDNVDYQEFCAVLQDIGIDTRPHQEAALRFAMTMCIEDWTANTLLTQLALSTFAERFLTNTCGLTWEEFEQFCIDNSNEFDDIEFKRTFSNQIVMVRK